MKIKRLVVILLSLSILLSLVGCSNESSTKQSETGASEITETPTAAEVQDDKQPAAEGNQVDDSQPANENQQTDSSSAEKEWAFMSGDPVTLTIYPATANAKTGLITGTIADWLEENYNIKLEVWAYSPEKTVSIFASGDLPDIMFFTNETDVDTAILGNMVVNLEDHITEMPNIDKNAGIQTALNYTRKFRSADTGKVYVMPLGVGASANSGVDTNRYALKLHWDTYEQLGCPEIKNLWDTVDVFKNMQSVRSVAADGTPVYALRLFYGYNSTYEATTDGFYSLYGYSNVNLPYLIETDMVNGKYKSILDKDSLYYQGVKWYNTLMREGLIDPDSINTDRKTAYSNTRAGYANAAVCWATAFSGEGFGYSFIDDMKIYYSTQNTYGVASQYMGVSANTNNLEACLCFLDLFADMDAVLQFRDGPVGEKFDVVDGKAKLSQKYIDFVTNSTGELFRYSKGDDESLINLSNNYIIGSGEPTSWGVNGFVGYWPESVEITSSSDEVLNKWKADMGYDSQVAMLKDKNALCSSSQLDDIASFTSTPDDSMLLTISSLETTVIDYTWKMYYAKTDEEFESLWTEMVDNCNSLGAEEVVNMRLSDLENAKSIRDSLAVTE